MSKQRGEYIKNKARNDIKDFIAEIYMKGIKSNLKTLKTPQYQDYYNRYVDLVNKLNNDENEKQKKSYRVRSADSQKDYLYFYTEGTRNIEKTRFKRPEFTEKRLELLQHKKKQIKQKIEDNKKEIKQQEEKIDKNNLYYILQQNTQKILLKKNNNGKTMLEEIIGQIPDVYSIYKKAIERCMLSEKIDAYKTISELTKSLAEYNNSIGFQNFIKIDPRAIQLIIQNNTQIDNKSININDNNNDDFSKLVLQLQQNKKDV